MARHSGTAFSTSGRIKPVDDLVDRLAGLQRPAEVGAGLLGGGGTGPVTAPGGSMAAAAKPSAA